MNYDSIHRDLFNRVQEGGEIPDNQLALLKLLHDTPKGLELAAGHYMSNFDCIHAVEDLKEMVKPTTVKLTGIV